jgi:molybdate transport system substrate-binding protein
VSVRDSTQRDTRRARSLGLPLIFAFAVLAGSACSGADKPQVTVAAAADLRFAFEEIAATFEQQCGCDVVLTFGSSGTLASQIQEGLPADLYFSANVSYVEELEEKSLILRETKQLYAIGRIVLAYNRAADLDVDDLADLRDPRIRKVAIANPAHAPYGVAAKEALEATGMWDDVSPRLVLGDNASQAAQFVQGGDASVGILPLSLAVGLKNDLSYTLIDDSLHAPLRQVAVVLKRSRQPELAKAFLEFVNGEQGRPVMRKYGFVLPGEEAQ